MKIFKKINYILISMLLVLCVVSAWVPAYAAEPEVTDVTLSGDEADAMQNYLTLSAALLAGDGETPRTVRLQPAKGTFYIDTKGASLLLKSGTTLDLNGAALVRYGTMAARNLIQNCNAEGENRTGGGYRLTKDITVKNGTLDGNEVQAEAGNNLVNLGHAENIRLTNLTFQNVNDAHLLELTGCKNCTVENCVFLCPQGSGEALQLDVAKNTWNGVYASDNTPCRGVTVRGCTFLDAPSGVGNHHSLTGGYHCENIVITGNTFINTVEYETPMPAVWCYGFDGSTVENNTVRGYYSEGVKISGGSVAVTGNVIALGKTPESCGVTVTCANSNLYEDETPGAREQEAAFDCSIKGNCISGYTVRGISVHLGSTVTEITNNRVTGGGTGIFVSKSTVTGQIAGNVVIGCKALSEDNPGHGIHIPGTGSAKTIVNNTVSGCAGYGIGYYATDAGLTVTGNLLLNNAAGAARIKGTGKISNKEKGVAPSAAAAAVKTAGNIVCTVQGTTATALRACVKNGNLVLTKNGKTAAWDAVLCTGMTITCTDGTKMKIAVRGDVDGDGEATAADARLALRIAVDLDKPDAVQKQAAAVTGKGTVDASDARLILRAAVGLERIGV